MGLFGGSRGMVAVVVVVVVECNPPFLNRIAGNEGSEEDVEDAVVVVVVVVRVAMDADKRGGRGCGDGLMVVVVFFLFCFVLFFVCFFLLRALRDRSARSAVPASDWGLFLLRDLLHALVSCLLQSAVE